MKDFLEFGLSPQLLEAIKRLGYEKPTEIQEKSILPVLAGKDVIGESATGSGKTLAFGTAIIEHCILEGGVQALILTPTRELAEQNKTVLTQIAYKKPLNIITVYGGVSMERQIHFLRTADVVVATPGRFLDHMRSNRIDMSKIKILVLDEADRMLDMGFIDDVEKIIRACPRKRQTLLFSATMAPQIKTLAHRYMVEPVVVSAKVFVDPAKLKQVYYNVPTSQKLSLLLHLLEHEKSGLVMVFCNTRRTVDFVVKNLRSNGVEAVAIHGGMEQNKRMKTLNAFNNAKMSVLACTDVAARGLHIDDVSHIYNYNIPAFAKDYVHRIGRTARAGEEGKVINLLCEDDYDNFSRLLDEYRNFNIEVTKMPEVKRIITIRKDERRPFQRGGQRGDSRGSPRGRFSGRGQRR